jgi:hypothetical protein
MQSPIEKCVAEFDSIEELAVLQAGISPGFSTKVLCPLLRDARCLVKRIALNEQPIAQIVSDAIHETAVSLAELVEAYIIIQDSTTNLSSDQKIDTSILTTAINIYPHILKAAIYPILQSRSIIQTTTPEDVENFPEQCENIQRQLKTLEETLFQSQDKVLHLLLHVRIGVAHLRRESLLFPNGLAFKAVTCAFDTCSNLLDLCTALLDSTESLTRRRISMLALWLCLGDFLRTITLTIGTLDTDDVVMVPTPVTPHIPATTPTTHSAAEILDQQPASIFAQGPVPTASITANNISVVSQHHQTSKVVYVGSEQGRAAEYEDQPGMESNIQANNQHTGNLDRRVRLPFLDLSRVEPICFGTVSALSHLPRPSSY